jgi:hypothetical protein
MALLGKSGASGGLKPGFRDLRWGDPPKPTMEVLDEQGPEKFCYIPNDDKTWGESSVDKIVYQFWNNRFSDVVLEIPTSSADRVLKDLNDGWGKPQQPNQFIEDFVWRNKALGPDATEGLYTRNPSTRAATLTIRSVYVQAKKNLERPKPKPR